MPNGKLFTKGNAGKPKGAKNKITLAVKEVFTTVFNDLQRDPKANLRTWGKANPTEFYKLASKLIPTEITGKDGNDLIPPILSDTQFESILSKLNGKAKTTTGT